MKQNLGTLDRIIRVIIGIAAAYLGYVSTGALMWVGYVVAAAMFLTALLGVCLLYMPFGISTTGKR